MIQDISTANLDFSDHNERDYLDVKMMEKVKPYFKFDLRNGSAEDAIQMFYNLGWVTQNIDLGLSHSLQHHTMARSYLPHLKDTDRQKELSTDYAYSHITGAKADLKPSDTVSYNTETSIIEGQKNWLTHLVASKWAIIEVINEKHQACDIFVDLRVIAHEVVTKNTLHDIDSIGLKYAKPSNLYIPKQEIPKEWVLGVYTHPNPLIDVQMFRHDCFFTNICNITMALFKETKQYIIDKNLISVKFVMDKVELDVITALGLWVKRLRSYKNKPIQCTEMGWITQHTEYLFVKKTLIQTLNLSREVGVPFHLLTEGKQSIVFRNALAFSSHMTKLYNLSNPWGDKSDTEIDLNHYVDMNIDNILNDTPYPSC